jgi:excisionase family DNA binding protein
MQTPAIRREAGDTRDARGSPRKGIGLPRSRRGITMRASRKASEPVPIGERLLTIGEAAEVLRLHSRTIREYVRRGELEGRVIGRRWRFRRKDLDAFYENAPRAWEWPGKGEDGD